MDPPRSRKGPQFRDSDRCSGIWVNSMVGSAEDPKRARRLSGVRTIYGRAGSAELTNGNVLDELDRTTFQRGPIVE